MPTDRYGIWHDDYEDDEYIEDDMPRTIPRINVPPGHHIMAMRMASPTTWQADANLDYWGCPVDGVFVQYPHSEQNRYLQCWNGVEPKCQSDLPTGFKYVGKYYATVGNFNGYISLLSLETFDCPHCALLKAKEILTPGSEIERLMQASAGWRRGRGSGNSGPSFCHANFLETDNIRFLDEQGRFDLNCDAIKDFGPLRGCAKCGFPGHTRATCARETKHYDKVGIEIEGKWTDLDEVSRRASEEGMDPTDDCSIRQSLVPGRHTGELRSEPGSLSQALNQLVDFYPDETDRSCGLHVHVSFQDPHHITQLTCQEFYDYFRARFKAWGEREQIPPHAEFWRRLNGENNFCSHNDAANGRDAFSDDRYRQLNFTAYDRHRTVECRMLPMFRRSSHSVSAIIELLSIYEDWLTSDFNATLPESVYSEVVDPSFVRTHSRTRELDLSAFTHEPHSLTTELSINELPPVPDGFVRIVRTPTNEVFRLTNDGRLVA